MLRFRIIRRRKPARKKHASRARAPLYLETKETARALVEERLLYFNQFYGHSIGSVSIRNQKTRWGSCSRKGNLNFNYRLALIAPALADYVIVHELCHLKEFSHKKAFWDLVSKTIPDAVERRAQLRKIRLS